MGGAATHPQLLRDVDDPEHGVLGDRSSRGSPAPAPATARSAVLSASRSTAPTPRRASPARGFTRDMARPASRRCRTRSDPRGGSSSAAAGPHARRVSRLQRQPQAPSARTTCVPSTPSSSGRGSDSAAAQRVHRPPSRTPRPVGSPLAAHGQRSARLGGRLQDVRAERVARERPISPVEGALQGLRPLPARSASSSATPEVERPVCERAGRPGVASACGHGRA